MQPWLARTWFLQGGGGTTPTSSSIEGRDVTVSAPTKCCLPSFPSNTAGDQIKFVREPSNKVFIRNQREQLKKEPAQAPSSHINPGAIRHP